MIGLSAHLTWKMDLVLEKKAPFTRLIFLTAPLFRAKTKERLWSQQEALLNEKLAPGFFLILVLKRGMGAGGVKQDQNGLDRSAS